MSVDKPLQELQQTIADLEVAKKVAAEKAKEKLGPALQQFLKEYPFIKTIAWTQYAPHFNDGDECIFRVNDIYFCTEKLSEYDYEAVENQGFSGGGSFDSSFFKDYHQDMIVAGLTEEIYNQATILSDTLRDAEDLLKEVFGNHVAVLVTSTGIDVQDHEHD